MKLHNHGMIPSLDGLRAVAITVVFFAHSRALPMLPGGFGVTVFFFLSGFLITTLFFREVEKTGRIDLKAFYIRRLLRLSPPLFITLAITYGLVAADVFKGVIDPAAIASQAFYYYNYYLVFDPNSTEGALGLNVLWSLAVEEHFYLIYPGIFLLLLAGRLKLAHLIVALGAILVWRVIRLVGLGENPFNIYISTDTRFDSILYGAVLAIMNARGISMRIFPQTARGRGLLLAGSALVLLFCFVWRDPIFRETLRYTLQGIALTPVFYYAVTRPEMWIFRPLNWAPVRLLGFYSYTVYLAHTVVLGNLHLIFQGHGRLLYSLVAAAVCVGYAVALNHFIEQPVRRWRRRLQPTGT